MYETKFSTYQNNLCALMGNDQLHDQALRSTRARVKAQIKRRR
jgi:hypothetical protein